MKNLKEVINQFLELLNQRDTEACHKLIAEYHGMPDACRYFDALLSDVTGQSWDKLQSVCQDLLKTPSVDDFLKGQAAVSLGIVCDYQAKWPEALAAYAKAEHIFQELCEPIEEAKALKQVNATYHRGYRQGDFELQGLRKGLKACQRSIAILEDLPQSIDVNNISADGLTDLKASTWNSLGMIHNSLSEFNDAKDAFLQALDYTSDTNNRFLSALIHDSLGETYYMAGEFNDAESQYLKALGILNTLERDANYSLLTVITNLAFLMQRTTRYQEALFYYQQAIGLIEYIRSNNDIKVRTGFASTVAHTYANAVLTCIEANEKELAFDYVQQARSRAFLDTISAGNTQESNAPISVKALSLVEVQTRLPDDVLLLEYFTTGLIESKQSREHENRPGFPDSRTFIFVVTSSDIEIYPASMPPNDFLPSDLRSVVEKYFLKSKTQQDLYRVLLAPILPWATGKKMIYLVPHGPLHYIPFQAILSQEPQFWLEPDDAPHLIYTPSATILCSDLDQNNSVIPSQLNQRGIVPCLTVGFNGNNSNNNLSHVKGAGIQLGFAESEAHSIAQLTNGRALVGSESKKECFLLKATNYRRLHISCHGYFDPEDPLGSALYLANDEYLTAQEVLDQLSTTCDLVILSACETGLSLVQRGDELFGLVRAFLSAGTKAMIVTQWRVDEGSTTILMEKFYGYLQEGQSYPDALRQARKDLMEMSCAEVVETLEHYKKLQQNAPQTIQESMDLYIQHFSQEPADKKIFANPYYWAPFILITQELE